MYLYVCRYIHPSVHPSVCISVRPSVCQNANILSIVLCSNQRAISNFTMTPVQKICVDTEGYSIMLKFVRLHDNR